MNKFIKKIFTFSHQKKQKPEKIKVCWHFLALVMNAFYLTDDEIIEFLEIDDRNPDILVEIIRIYVIPYYQLLSAKSHEKIRNTLAYYLTVDNEKLDWPFSSFHIPLNDDIAKLFYSLLWKELYGTDSPEPVNPDDYEEDCSTNFIMSIYDRDPEDVVIHSSPVPEKPSFSEFMERLRKIQNQKPNE